MCLTYIVCADPFANDENFLLSMLTLEELGATGNKGLIGLTSNPVLANGIAGLATSATAQATIEVGTCLTLSPIHAACDGLNQTALLSDMSNPGLC